MTRRRAWLLAVAAVIILCLFAGRTTAELLADRWWAAQFSPTAARLAGRWHAWALGLGAFGVVVSTGWFIAHMLVVIRAVGSVQILRDVGGLQFREMVRPGAIKAVAVIAGICLGLVTGLGLAGEWQTVLLALHGVSLGLRDPLLGHDAGWYIARLPLWQLLHDFLLALSLLAFLATLMFYAVMGALRFERRRPAINDHARQHLGVLLASTAMVIAWGFLLHAPGQAAASDSTALVNEFRRGALVGPALAGTALMVAALSVLWAWRGRHALLAAGWAVLAVATLVARTGVPLLIGGGGEPLPDSAIRAFEDSAFGLGPAVRPAGLDLRAAPRFDRDAVARLFVDSGRVVSVSPATVRVGVRRHAAWLALVERTGSAPSLVAIAADTASASGAALALRLGDSLAYPTLYAAQTFGPAAPRPGAPDVAIADSGRGVATGTFLRRLLLAWAVQSRLPFSGARVDWALHPTGRLERLAPFAAWSAARAAVIRGKVRWLADGYVAADGFPLVASEAWSGGDARFLRAGFLGIVDPETGQARMYLRPDGGALARAWADIASGLVRPAAELDEAVLAAAGPPMALVEVQSRLMVRRLASAEGDAATETEPGAPGIAWDSAGDPVAVLPVTLGTGDHLAAVVEAGPVGPPSLVPVDSAPLPTPRDLERLWGRFATFAPIQDSVAGAGARLTSGSVHLWLSPKGLAAFEVFTAARPGARPAIVWVTVATPDRLGAGRSFEAAWENLLGNSSPLAPGAGGGTVDQARYWMRIADEALRRGDWEAFGRAFDALRGVLNAVP